MSSPHRQKHLQFATELPMTNIIICEMDVVIAVVCVYCGRLLVQQKKSIVTNSVSLHPGSMSSSQLSDLSIAKPSTEATGAVTVGRDCTVDATESHQCNLSCIRYPQWSQHIPPKIQDILQDIWEKNTGHFTGLQKSISLNLLGIIVSQQYSISSDVGGQ